MLDNDPNVLLLVIPEGDVLTLRAAGSRKVEAEEGDVTRQEEAAEGKRLQP
jgi:hypothetical protein